MNENQISIQLYNIKFKWSNRQEYKANKHTEITNYLLATHQSLDQQQALPDVLHTYVQFPLSKALYHRQPFPHPIR